MNQLYNQRQGQRSTLPSFLWCR